MDKYDTSQLTEFPKFEAETSQSGVSNFFNKLWKFPMFLGSENAENLNIKELADGNTIDESEENVKEDYEEVKAETGTYVVEYEGRSLPNVLKRISSLIALGSGSGTKYADTELARYWMPDDISRECYECASRFSTLRRRHHCRVCGQIFCSRCCSQRVPGHIFGCAGGLRVCNYCCNVVLSYLKENEMTGEISPDLRTLQENLQIKFPENKSHMLQTQVQDNFTFAREQEERCDSRGSPKEALLDVFRQLSFTLPTQQHRYRLVRYNGVWRGCDILQWIIDNTNNKTRAQASLVCEALLSAGYMECTTEMPHFADYALYRPMVLPPNTSTDDDSPEECKRLAGSVSSYCLDLNLGNSSARLTKAPKKENKLSSSDEEDHHILEHSDEHTESSNVCKAIAESGTEHLKLLLRQCLARHAVPATWADILYPLCVHAADIIMPDVNSSDIDVRNYVQVKKVPGGSVRDSCVVSGIVLTKNVAHRGMPQQITNPSILLLDCSIAYQRVEGKLTSLEPVLMQEQEYLARCAARITDLSPRVVLVRGWVSRGVQEALLARGVALACGVRARALRRVARVTRADLVASIDARIAPPRLGNCADFYVRNYSGKTLMVLEGGAEPHLGCCILLRGAPVQELIKVKKVVKFMLLACYNWKLEKAFLGDIEAILPEPGMALEDDEANDTNDDTKIDTDIMNDMIAGNNSDVDENPNVKLKDSNKSSQNSTRESGALEQERKEQIKDIKTQELTDDDVKTDCTPEFDDPLQKAKTFARKTDSDKNLSCGVPIKDFSDPLHSTLSVEDDVFLPKEETKLKADPQTERWSTDDVVLSMSPNIVIPAPYLETEAGRRCPLRRHFPTPLLTPRPPNTPRAPHTPHTPRKLRSQSSQPAIQMQHKEHHPFIAKPITSPADEPALRASLAHFRATGGRTDAHQSDCPLYKPSVVKKKEKVPISESNDENKDGKEPLDPFSPENHQRLSLLLYTFSNKSANVPDFCVNPWIATMEMYGRYDISLGAFLDKYCFNNDLKCSTNSCQVPMNQHVRRLVHGDVCITITCNTIGHSNLDKLKESQSKQVMFWSRCGRCGAGCRGRVMSRGALSLSLAGFLRLRLSAPRYRRAACPHPLHHHLHAFSCRLTTASFKYSKISTYDIELPPEVISIKYNTMQIRETLIQQLNELVHKGHEIFSNLSEGDANKEYVAFKCHMDQIHLALTSTHLQMHTTQAAVIRSLWSVSDRIILGEMLLQDAQDKWAAPLAKLQHNKQQPDSNTVEEKSDLEDSAGEGNNSAGTTYVFNSDNGSKDEKDHTGTEEDEEKGDKKTVRQILSQLLSNNQPSNQSGMIISSGVLPVVVMSGEIGSVIAAALASITYHRTLDAMRNSTQSEQDDAEVANSTGKDKTDASKSTKPCDHIEVLLKEGLLCRVYFALQFYKLRQMFLAPLERGTGDEGPGFAGDKDCTTEVCTCDECTERNDNRSGRMSARLSDVEEGFVRSMCACVPWAARGGKSGSTFCKTTDDRYVLKEMTKSEWQRFLEFAPHYFNYVITCHQNQQPSLLGRIVGVYSVGGAGNGVLVMENIWYGCSPATQRFDLKGSSRHRLAPHTHAQALAVLMDENLLNLRWDTPLYVSAHAGSVLWTSVERDTRFLARHDVMDYSLLLGIDGNKLVLGIIDYIRTFTWDKKLEHLVKKSLGPGQPTVVSPEQYKRRFCIACRKYFLQCPSHWDHLHPIIHA